MDGAERDGDPSSGGGGGGYEPGDLSPTSFAMDLHNLALDDPVRAEDAVQIMAELHAANPGNSATFSPDSSCYTTVMDGYIQAGRLEEAQRVLDRMEALAAADEDAHQGDASAANTTEYYVSPLAPTDLTYQLMAQAWASDHQDDFTGRSAERAVGVLRTMQEAARRRGGRVPLAAGSGSCGGNSNATTSGLVKVWSIAVEGWCKRAGIARGAVEAAGKLLDEMEAAGMEEEDGSTAVRPNVLTYTSYIGGLSRSRRHDMARRAEAVLERMEAAGVRPDVVAYTGVLNCYARAVSRSERNVAASRALAILSKMEGSDAAGLAYDARPSLITYGAAIAAIGNSLDPSSPELAEGVLRRMYRLSRDGSVAGLKPVTSTYNAVLYALSRAPVRDRLRHAQRAEALVAEMERRAAEGEGGVRPDVRTWATVLRAWARSGREDSAENAQRVLNMMENRYREGTSGVRPNYVCFTTVGSMGTSVCVCSLCGCRIYL